MAKEKENIEEKKLRFDTVVTQTAPAIICGEKVITVEEAIVLLSDRLIKIEENLGV